MGRLSMHSWWALDFSFWGGGAGGTCFLFFFLVQSLPLPLWPKMVTNSLGQIKKFACGGNAPKAGHSGTRHTSDLPRGTPRSGMAHSKDITLNFCCMARFLQFTLTPYWAHSPTLTLGVTLHLLFVNKSWESLASQYSLPLATKQQHGESKYVKLTVVRFFAS
jgi:hypothetical protein